MRALIVVVLLATLLSGCISRTQRLQNIAASFTECLSSEILITDERECTPTGPPTTFYATGCGKTFKCEWWECSTISTSACRPVPGR